MTTLRTDDAGDNKESATEANSLLLACAPRIVEPEAEMLTLFFDAYLIWYMVADLEPEPAPRAWSDETSVKPANAAQH